MKRAVIAAALVVILGATQLIGQQAPAFNRYEVLSVLEVYLESMRQQAGIPGMSAAIVRDGTILWERGFGFQDVAGRVRATVDTPYLIGEASGTLASVLLLQCVQERRIDLEQPLRRYGVTVPEISDAMLGQVLSHTSTEGPAGTFLYAPERFGQLTTVMEYCAPQPYRKSVSHRVLNRLAMIDSAPGTDLSNPDLELPEGLFSAAELERYRRTLDRIALPYRVDSKGRAERSPIPIVTMNAIGGLVTTVRDLARFEGAMLPVPDSELRPGLLLQETLDMAWHPATNRNGLSAPMGLGWFVQTYRGQRVVWHYSNVPNAYSSLVLRVPAYDLTFILLANSDRLSAPYQLQQGDVTKSLFATLFLRLFT